MICKDCGFNLFTVNREDVRHKDLRFHDHIILECADCGGTSDLTIDGEIQEEVFDEKVEDHSEE